ncbi:hypothetical protein HZB60_12275 [candidate division KSB1 bacterium]|nr:hypothetical protein [candidate division KSB1 bacterium]
MAIVMVAMMTAYTVSTLITPGKRHHAGQADTTGQGCGMSHGIRESTDTRPAEPPAGDTPHGSASRRSAATSTYPIDYCIVCDQKLGDAADPVTNSYDGREVRFCGAVCARSFEQDWATHMQQLDAAIVAAEQAAYPLRTCVVSGAELTPSTRGVPVDYVYDNHLVRFCCNRCPATFEQDPDKYLRIISDAYRTENTSKAATAHPDSAPQDQQPKHRH